jgi:hypothetical protein
MNLGEKLPENYWNLPAAGIRVTLALHRLAVTAD